LTCVSSKDNKQDGIQKRILGLRIRPKQCCVSFTERDNKSKIIPLSRIMFRLIIIHTFLLLKIDILPEKINKFRQKINDTNNNIQLLVVICY
jgi:hypothetical protein